jgi:hypothetical protein
MTRWVGVYVSILFCFFMEEAEVGVGGSCLVGCRGLAVLYGVVDIAIVIGITNSYAVQCANMRKLANSVASISQARKEEINNLGYKTPKSR